MDDKGRIKLLVHGVRSPLGQPDFVSGRVFGVKLVALVQALEAADKAINGTLRHTYKLRDLAMGSAVAELSEMTRPTQNDVFGSDSGVHAFGDCLRAITLGKTDAAKQYGSCSKHVSKLAAGAGKQFGYGEIWVNDDPVIRLDDFLEDQAKAAIAGSRIPAEIEKAFKFYKGFADASFYGEVKEADLRGDLPQIKLVVGGGVRELDCVCTRSQVEQIRAALDRRARVSGRAYYDGSSGFPRRLEVRSIDPIKPAGDFTRWRGAFEPSEGADWANEA